jgi:hypothetical protein
MNDFGTPGPLVDRVGDLARDLGIEVHIDRVDHPGRRVTQPLGGGEHVLGGVTSQRCSRMTEPSNPDVFGDLGGPQRPEPHRAEAVARSAIVMGNDRGIRLRDGDDDIQR